MSAAATAAGYLYASVRIGRLKRKREFGLVGKPWANVLAKKPVVVTYKRRAR